MNRNKAEEILQQFERFSELCSDIPAGAVQIWEGTNDPPDVCIGDHELGIEFRNFLHGEKPDLDGDSKRRGSDVKASESLFDEIVDNAQREFEQQQSLRLWVSVFWSSHTRPKKPQKTELVAALLEVISRAIPRFDDQPEFGDLEVEIEWDDFADTCLEKFLDAIHIWRLADSESGHWTCPRAAYVGFGAKSFEASRASERKGFVSILKQV